MFTDCRLTGSSFLLSDKNELTISWTISEGSNYHCNFTEVSVNLTQTNCAPSECNTIIISKILTINFRYTLKENLEACASYEYTIESIGSEDTKNFTTKEQFEKVKLNIEQDHDDSTSIRVFWKSTAHLLCPKKFRVEIKEGNDVRKEYETTKMNETITGLEPCVTYEIKVYPIQSDNSISSENVVSEYHTMNSALPSGIQELTLNYDKSENSIDISWSEPDFGKKCIDSYEISSESSVDNRTKTSTVQKENIPNVFACIEYKIKVKAKTGNEMEGAEVFDFIRIPSRGNQRLFFSKNLFLLIH